MKLANRLSPLVIKPGHLFKRPCLSVNSAPFHRSNRSPLVGWGSVLNSSIRFFANSYPSNSANILGSHFVINKARFSPSDVDDDVLGRLMSVSKKAFSVKLAMIAYWYVYSLKFLYNVFCVPDPTIFTLKYNHRCELT